MGKQEEENVAIVKRFYQYLADGDRDGAYKNIMAEDCVLHEAASLPYGGIYHGRDHMKDVLASVTGRFDEFEVEIYNYLAGGDEVVVHLRIAGVGRVSRKPFDTPIMELWRIRDGKVIEMRPFLYDAPQVIAALA
ncbi:MAG: nuclear transport factor 2 family protein [Novosphingobium sp.]|nr:nuclear transport factor 2 family protein [Novosphingobium sp.]